MARGYCQARVTCSLPLRSSAMSALLITGDSRAVNKSSSCGPPSNHSTSMCVKHLVTLLGLLAFSSAITCSVHCYYNDIILHYPSSTVSDVRPIFIFAISNSYVLLSLLNTLGKPENFIALDLFKRMQRYSFLKNTSQGKILTKIYCILMYLGGTYEICC